MKRGLSMYLALLVCASGCSLMGDARKSEDPYSAPEFGLLLRETASYEIGNSRKTLLEIERIVFNPGHSPEIRAQIARQLALVLEMNATFDCKQMVCQHLALVGTAEQAPALAPLLADERLAEPARYALERIPGPESLAALIDSLSGDETANRIGVMNSLGAKGDPAAVPALVEILGECDIVEAAAAAVNLGEIGGDEAAKALQVELDTPAPSLRHYVPDAYLKCADRFLAEGKPEKAIAIYQELCVPGGISPFKIPAFLGLVRAQGEARLPDIVTTLHHISPEWREAGLSAARVLPGENVTQVLAEELKNLPSEMQALLLDCLRGRGARGYAAGVDEVRQVALSDSVKAKVAAIEALGSLGGHKEVIFLAEIAAGDSKPQKDAARASLVALSGWKVSSTILKSLSKAAPETRVELIRCVGPRRIKGSASVLLKAAKDPDPAIRMAALDSLAHVADEGDMPKLIDLLLGAEGSAERKRAEKTLLAVSRGVNDKDKRSAPVLKALAKAESDEPKSLLLSILASMGGPNALNAVTTALEDQNEEIRGDAVRSLANWENADPLLVLRELSEWEDDEALRVIALRGYIRQIGMHPVPSMEEWFPHYKHAMTFAAYDSEKKQIFSGVSRVRTLEALEFVAKYIEEESLRAEACVAAYLIGRHIVDIHGPETFAVMDRILELTDDEQLRSQALYVKNPQTAKLKAERRKNRKAADQPLEPGEDRKESGLQVGIQSPERGR